MSSLYKQYLEETGHRKIIETSFGFVTYEIIGQECYIVDIYITPSERRAHSASILADLVADEAKKSSCRLLTGSVNTRVSDPTRSIQVLIGYGMKFLKAEPHILWFGKELQ